MSLIDQVYERIEESVERVRYKESDSEVAQYYGGRTIFITGVTGFLGKCMLEKLLRSCPNIKRIYILMRESKKESLKERTEAFFQHEIFNQLKEKFPNFQNKVTVVRGDLMEEGLGLSAEDRNTVANEVNVMFHNAANVQFNEKVRVSLKVNVLGTKRMLDLAQECKHIDIFVYVSTAYSHCYNKNIEEIFYPFAADLKVIHEAIEADEKSENGLSEEALKLLLGRHPNVYTFTKAFSEELVRQYAQNAKFAHVVYRPSIVIAPVKEPMAGWYDNTLGPVLIFLAGPLGFGHTGYYHNDPLDCIPCDMTVNALFVITRDAHIKWENGQRQPLMYNYGSSTTNPATLVMADDYFRTIPIPERSSKAIWMMFTFWTSKFWLYCIMHFFFHFVPACIADLILILMGRKPRLLSIFFIFTKNLDAVDYFANGNWRINIPKTLEAIDKLNPADREIFQCDIRSMDWLECMSISWRGLKKYILKEDVTSEAAVRRYNLLWYAHYGLCSFLGFVLCYYLGIFGLCFYMYSNLTTLIF